MLFGKRERKVKRILIVEDEPLTAFDNETTLKDGGYEVVETVDGFDEALKAIGREQVDLILSDVRLRSQQTGIDLARAAKGREFRPSSQPAMPIPRRGRWRSVT
jgi:CheY-like chemotaxis protein